jgi:RimJ/RimL family protein N-acetyltransferase
MDIRIFSPENITENYLNALNQKEIIGLTEARHQHWDKQTAVQFIENANKPGESILFGVFLNRNNKPVGNIRLFNFHEIHRRAELSFLFYDTIEWGKGYATESLGAVIEYAFKKIKLNRIHADYYEVNTASKKVFEKLGFQVEGIYRDHFWLDNRYVDSVRVGKINSSSE